MSRWFRELGYRAAALGGLGISVLLIAQYRQPVGALCAPGGGCDVVRYSAYAAPLGVPLPILGALYFALAFALAIAPQTRRWLLPLGALGVLSGLTFIGIQAFVLRAFCPLCLIVDGAALLLGAFAFSLRGVAPPRPTLVAGAAQIVALVGVSVAAIGWYALLARQDRSAIVSGELPSVVQREQDPRRVTVVEFVDFQCPACRAQYGQFKQILAGYQDQVSVVLKHMPLSQHEHADDAARAFCCAEESGAAVAMADHLFGAERLGPQECEETAVRLGLDRDAFRRCVDSEWVAERLREDRSAAQSAGIRGLPTFWIGKERFEGVHDDATLRSSIERQLRRGAQG